MSKNIPSELDNPREEKILAKEEVKKGQESLIMEGIVREELNEILANIETLINVLEKKYLKFIERKNLTKKEEIKLRKKIVGVFKQKLVKINKKRNGELRLKNLDILKNEVEEILKMEIDDYLKDLNNKKNSEEDFDSSKNEELFIAPEVVELEADLSVEDKENQTDKVKGGILSDLSGFEYEGEHSLVKDKIIKSERQKIIDRYGNENDVYLRYDEGGFPTDSIEIVGYEFNGGQEGNFVEIKKVVGDKEVREKIDLNEFDKYLSAGNYEREKTFESVTKEREKLTSEEQTELKIFVEEILAKIDADLVSLRDMIKNKDVEERIKKRILLYEENGLKKIREIIKTDKSIFESQDILNLTETLHLKIKTALDTLSDKFNEADKFLESLNEREKQTLEKIGELIEETKNGLKEAFDWGKLSERRIEQIIEDQTIMFLMNNFTKQGLFVDREELAAEYIFKNKK
ncbi:MAG: hypothetical protein V3574_02205 [Candidatus Moraniibacteriota bacterium]